MKTQLTNTKINGHGYKKGRVWNLAHLLPKRRLVLISTAPGVAPQPSPSAANPVPEEKPHSFNPPNPRRETRDPDSALPSPLRELSASAVDSPKPQPPDSTVQQFHGSTPDSPTRVGKIARLPEDTREQVNHMLRNNLKYSEISEQLAKLGYPGISQSNICNWKHGGFVDWYRQQELRDVALAPLKALERCTRAVEIDRWQQNAVTIAAEKFAMILVQFNQQRAVEALHANPELLPKYISAMTALSRCTSELAKSFDLTQKRQAALQAELVEKSADVPNAPPEVLPSETPEPATTTRLNREEPSNGHSDSTRLNRLEPNLTRFNQIAPNLTSSPVVT